MLEVIEEAKNNLTSIGIDGVDEAPLFVFGFSAGSVMAHRMACTHSDMFKAAAAISGTLNYPGNKTKTLCARALKMPRGPVISALKNGAEESAFIF